MNLSIPENPVRHSDETRDTWTQLFAPLDTDTDTLQYDTDLCCSRREDQRETVIVSGSDRDALRMHLEVVPHFRGGSDTVTLVSSSPVKCHTPLSLGMSQLSILTNRS